MIVATAGHIDHGKTQLIKALTGINTDRLPEEKKRGMSIDLGFAYKDLGNGITIGFVDVPGHARFINNMLAGVAGIDFSLLVIAADDGPMPQTLEHLAILDFLEINRGAVVISKVDKVNTERTEEVKEVTKSLLKGTRFEKVPLFQVASILNLGVKNLLKYIEDEAEKTIKKEASGNFRLAIDRSFSLKGSGVVVTGSVFSGCASVGDEFILSPKGKKVRIRAIHSQNKVSKKTFTGERCALNITGTGINANSISRGDWILSNYINYSSIRMDADIRVMTDKVKPLKHWTPAHIHLGTAKVTCRIAILQNKMLQPGGKGFVQLVLNKPISCFYGDHFILRDVSAETTIAGGIIIDPFSLAKGRCKQGRISRLIVMTEKSSEEVISKLLLQNPNGINLNNFTKTRNLTLQEINNVINLLDLKKIEDGDKAWIINSKEWKKIGNLIIDTVFDFYKKNITNIDLYESELIKIINLKIPIYILKNALREKIRSGELIQKGKYIYSPKHSPNLSSQDLKIWKKVQPILNKNNINPPLVREIGIVLNIEQKLLEKFFEKASKLKLVIRISPKRYFIPMAIRNLAKIAEELGNKERNGKLSMKKFQITLCIGRNLTIEILEFFDKVGFTKRLKDKRLILKSSIDVLK